MRVLGYDLGGSSLRLGILSPGEAPEPQVQISMKMRAGKDGEYEVDPQDWWTAFQNGFSELAAKVPDPAQIDAVAGCGFTRSQVPVSEDGTPVHPCITFQDSRGSRSLAEYLVEASGDLPQRYADLSPFHPVARLLWLRSRKPEVWARVHKVLEPKDYINFRLTGAFASDWISQNAWQSFFEALEGDARSRDALGIGEYVMPEPVSPFDEVGQVRSGLPGLEALAGKPVFCGSTDTWLCALGSGALKPGSAYCVSGTSDVSGILMNTHCEAEGLLTVRWGPSLWQLGGPSQGAAPRLAWAAEQFTPELNLEQAIAQGIEADGNVPIFLPYLEGERTPFWDKTLRGAFLGLDGNEGPGEFVWSVAEGINFLSRIVLERAEDAAGTPASHICFAGGLSNNPTLCQLKADVTNRPVHVAACNEAGLIGAAYLPFNNTGALDRIAGEIMASGTWYYPKSGQRSMLDGRFEIFKKASEALLPISRLISEFAQEEGKAVS